MGKASDKTVRVGQLESLKLGDETGAVHPRVGPGIITVELLITRGEPYPYPGQQPCFRLCACAIGL